jgi:uncharacterized membrane protein YgcG
LSQEWEQPSYTLWRARKITDDMDAVEGTWAREGARTRQRALYRRLREAPLYVCVRMARAKEMPRVRVGSEAVVRGGRKRGRGEEGRRGPKGSGGGGGGGSVQVDRGVGI